MFLHLGFSLALGWVLFGEFPYGQYGVVMNSKIVCFGEVVYS